MNTNDNTENNPRLDGLLARHAVRASDTFADQTLARLAAYEAEVEVRLDTLLSRFTVAIGHAFTEKTLARIAAEPADEKLDELLAAQVVEASPEFSPVIMARIRREEAGPTHRQRWFASVAGLAAAVAIAFVSLVPPAQTAAVATQIETASSADATTHTALALANGLSGADGLLDGETIELLDLLSEQPGI